MPLEPGAHLGSYEILSCLGVGGMGEVYRARDSKLGREVAIKVLLEQVASDPERLARFEREARVLAALNHANVATLHGLEQDGETSFLVMELAEGESLADRIARGPIPVDEAIPLFLQVAAGLEAAHDKGIVHRDLKPANVQVGEGGSSVKILDFGLATALAPEATGSDVSESLSPTLTLAATQHGEILGTAAYMSPEQARGKPVDKRADIWAFGVCLFEALTGTRAFSGQDVTDVLAAVIRDEPDFDDLPANTPTAVRRLLRRCLVKDRRERLRDIGDAAIDLREAGADDHTVVSAPPTSAAAPLKKALPLLAALLMGAAITYIGSQLSTGEPREGSNDGAVKLSFPVEGTFSLAASPDGQEIVFASGGTLNRRALDSFQSTAVSGSAGIVRGSVTPRGANNFLLSYSPDGTDLALFDHLTNRLMRLPASGGAATVIGETEVDITGLRWHDDFLLVAKSREGIWRYPIDGGQPVQLIAMADGESAAHPQLLPGGNSLLYTMASGSPTADWSQSQVVVQPLHSGDREILFAGSDARYLESGHLIYLREGVCFAIAFDPRQRRARGTAVPVIEGVARRYFRGRLRPGGVLSVSSTGTLAYLPGPASFSQNRRLLLTDRSGRDEIVDIPAGPFEAPRISPDGEQLAFSSNSDREAAIWLYDLSGESAVRRLPFAGRHRLPVWSPDGTRLAVQRQDGGESGLAIVPADGGAEIERLTTALAGEAHIPESWSRDGRFLAFSVLGAQKAELWFYSFDEARAGAFGDVVAQRPLNSVFSPDGKWLAYTLRQEELTGAVYVQSVVSGVRYQVSEPSDAAHHPFWSPDGRELFYFAMGGGTLVKSSITLAPSVRWSKEVVVPGDLNSNTDSLGPLNYDITPDGRHFVRVANVGYRPPDLRASSVSIAVGYPEIRVVLNWFEELERLVPTH